MSQSPGADRTIFDEVTFEDGMKPIDEITHGLDASDIFVLFISDSFPESDWVKKEISASKDAHHALPSKRFYPVIIDSNIDAFQID